MTSGKFVVSLMGLTSCRVRFYMGWGKCQMSQLFPYKFVPPLKEVYCTTPVGGGGGTISFGKKAKTKLHRYVCGNRDLHKVCFDLYCPNCCYAFH